MMVAQKCNKFALKTLRTRLKMSQTQFAEALGLNRQATVSDWENGRHIPEWISRAKILDALLKEAGMSWEDIPEDITEDVA